MIPLFPTRVFFLSEGTQHGTVYGVLSSWCLGVKCDRKPHDGIHTSTVVSQEEKVGRLSLHVMGFQLSTQTQVCFLQVVLWAIGLDKIAGIINKVRQVQAEESC